MYPGTKVRTQLLEAQPLLSRCRNTRTGRTRVCNTHYLIKVPKGLAPDPVGHTTSAELGSHQPRLLVGRGRHRSATKHSQWDAMRKRSVGLFLITDCGGFAVSPRFHIPMRSEPHSRESPSIGSSLTFKDIYHSHAALSFIQFTHSSQTLADPFSAPLSGAYILLHAWG